MSIRCDKRGHKFVKFLEKEEFPSGITKMDFRGHLPNLQNRYYAIRCERCGVKCE